MGGFQKAMKLCVFTTSYWDNEEHAKKQFGGKLGLIAWLDRVTRLLKPAHAFIACGSYSDRTLNQTSIPVINSGTPKTKPYSFYWWHYSLCAFMAGKYYALNRDNWDVLIQLDTDGLIGAVDLPGLISEFMDRPEFMLACPGGGAPSGPIQMWKREGAARYVNYRMRPNLIDVETDQKPIMHEHEWMEIFKGMIWYPWPNLRHFTHDYGPQSKYMAPFGEALKWPFIRMPHPDIIDQYIATQESRCIPMP